MANGNIPIEWMMGMMSNKIVVPSDYHSQIRCVKGMLKDDVSGFIDSLTDFAVNSASVNYYIESGNENLDEILNNWLQNINLSQLGRIPIGINALSEEYFKERWKYSAFPIFKILKWEKNDILNVPSEIFLLDGGVIKAQKNTGKISTDDCFNDYRYYLNNNSKTELKGNNVLFAKTNGRWNNAYPTPFLIKRGIYRNYSILKSLKENQSKVLDQIIPYMLLVKKGTESLATNDIKNYSAEELKAVIDQFQTLYNKVTEQKHGELNGKVPVRATQFDEEIETLIPNLMNLFDPKLFSTLEKNILSGLGFIEVLDSATTSRREAVVNPKIFIEEVKKGVTDFKFILRQLLYVVAEHNPSNRKYMNEDIKVKHTPITAFITEDFKDKLRQMYDRGVLSIETYAELVGEVDFEQELNRRQREAKKGYEEDFYPHLLVNQEEKGFDLNEEFVSNPDEITEDNKTEDKKSINKHQYFMSTLNSSLEGAPYSDIKELPKQIKDNMSIDLQRTFMKVFNQVYNTSQKDSQAMRVAWSVIRKIARKDKKGMWVRKKERENGKLTEVTLTKGMLEEAISKDKEPYCALSEVMNQKKLEVADKQIKLLDLLLKNKEDADENISR